MSPPVIDCHAHAIGLDVVNLGRRRLATSQSALDLPYGCAMNEVHWANPSHWLIGDPYPASAYLHLTARLARLMVAFDLTTDLWMGQL